MKINIFNKKRCGLREHLVRTLGTLSVKNRIIKCGLREHLTTRCEVWEHI